MSKDEQKNAEFNIQDFRKYEFIWRNSGKDFEDPEKKHTIQDAIATSDAPVFLPKVVENVVKEAAEPLLVGTSLLQRVQFTYGQTITFPAVGALDAVFEIAEGQEYPELTTTKGGSTMTANIGKCGCAVSITEEMVRYSQFDVIAMMLRMAGRALARYKEKKIFNYISDVGVHVFDNLSPGTSVYGVTHGRSMNGEANGSCTMDDVFDCYAHVITQGFTPDTLLMHPLTWTMWIKDPILRYFALAAGGGTFFATHRGNPAGQAPWSNSSQGGRGVASGQNLVPGGNAAGLAASTLLEYPQTINSAPQLPSYFGYPFTIIVSPMVAFNPRSKLTDIYMFDRAELGFHIVDQDLTTDEFNDPRFDIRKVKVMERYGLHIANEGQGIAVMKNVKVVPNEIVLPAQTTISSGVSGAVLPISATENVLA
jgi:hypothetical protein